MTRLFTNDAFQRDLESLIARHEAISNGTDVDRKDNIVSDIERIIHHDLYLENWYKSENHDNNFNALVSDLDKFIEKYSEMQGHLSDQASRKTWLTLFSKIRNRDEIRRKILFCLNRTASERPDYFCKKKRPYNFKY